MATPKPNQEKIDALIRQNKIERTIKYRSKTSFKPGQKVANAGRKKGSKTDMQKQVLKHWKKHFELLVATMVVSMQEEDIANLSMENKMKYLPTILKYWMPEMKAVETKETTVSKIEVSFSENFGDKPIDISHEEIDEPKSSEE